MGANINIILSGFGGQGLLFAGKIVAQAGLIENRHISWLPSYGPEMRGGTAYCSVCLSDDPIGSPLVVNPDVLIAMNQPSVDRFEDKVTSGGLIIIDESLVPNPPTREDVRVIRVPATSMAEDEGISGLANVILTGRLFAETAFCKKESLDEALLKVIPPRKQKLLVPNQRAIQLGIDSAARA